MVLSQACTTWHTDACARKSKYGDPRTICWHAFKPRLFGRLSNSRRNWSIYDNDSIWIISRCSVYGWTLFRGKQSLRSCPELQVSCTCFISDMSH